jgi:four helix bundle protein
MTEDRKESEINKTNLLTYKFEKLKVWELSLDLSDMVYKLALQLPDLENNNLKPQFRRAVTSISLNIAEGSTNLTDKEQARFLTISLRSLIETIACVRIMIRKKYFDSTNKDVLAFDKLANNLFIKLNSFIKSLKNK